MIMLKNVCKSYEEVIALKNIHLHVDNGDFITIVGGNGAGKSTLFNIISGADKPDSGEVIINDKEITHNSEFIRSRYIGRVFQDPKIGTIGSMTVEENMSMAYVHGRKPRLRFGVNKKKRLQIRMLLSKHQNDLVSNFNSEKAEKYDTYLHKLNLQNRLKTKVETLSGGQRQYLAVLMAFLTKPSILLLDEHTASLDPIMAEIVLKMSVNMANYSKTTTLMITHNIDNALSYGNRMIMMDAGNIILDIGGDKKNNFTEKDIIEKFGLDKTKLH